MLYTIVALSYSAANVIIAIMILVKYRQALLSKFYVFCVGCLLAIAILGWSRKKSASSPEKPMPRVSAIFVSTGSRGSRK